MVQQAMTSLVERVARALCNDGELSWYFRMLEAENAIRAIQETHAIADKEPVAWVYELARGFDRNTGEYTDWGSPQVSFAKPTVPVKSIRNLRPLLAAAPDVLKE